MSQSISLTPIAAPANLAAYDGGLGIKEPYDPTFKFMRYVTRGRVNPIINVQALCAALEREEYDEIGKISAVIHAWTKKTMNRVQLHPAIFEEGGVASGGVPMGSAVVVADDSGDRVAGQDVLHVFYTNRNPNGAHVVCPAEPGTLFAVGRRDAYNITMLVYRVDHPIPLDGETRSRLMPPEQDAKKHNARNFTAINATLMGIRTYRDNNDALGWDRLNDEGSPEVDVSYLIDQLIRKLSSTSYEAINIERFYPVKVGAKREKRHRCNVPGMLPIVEVVDPADFYKKICSVTSLYRKSLSDASEKSSSYPLPAEVHCIPRDDGSVSIAYALPRPFSNTTMEPIEIQTTLTDSIPEEIRVETGLYPFDVDTVEEFHASILAEMEGTPEGVHHISITIETHA